VSSRKNVLSPVDVELACRRRRCHDACTFIYTLYGLVPHYGFPALHAVVGYAKARLYIRPSSSRRRTHPPCYFILLFRQGFASTRNAIRDLRKPVSSRRDLSGDLSIAENARASSPVIIRIFGKTTRLPTNAHRC